MPFNDLQGVLNDQFQVVFDLFTDICLSENSIVQQSHTLVLARNKFCEVGLSNDLII